MPDDFIGGDPGASLGSGSLLSRLDALDHLLTRASGKVPELRPVIEGGLSARTLFLAGSALLLLLILPPLVERALRRAGSLARNFRGEEIVQSYGTMIALFAAAMLLLANTVMPSRQNEWENALILTLGFGGLGFLDDRVGTKEPKGLKGHVRALLQKRRVTTGLLKACGGLALAFWISLRISPDFRPGLMVDALLIALSANAFNLLDLRPGRACAAFLAVCTLWLTTLVFSPPLGRTLPLLLFVIPACRAWVSDAAAKVMLGDTGSNLLGAAFGLALASSSLSVSIKAGIVLALLAFHLFAERFSLTHLIERNTVLRGLDRLTGEREEG